MTSQNDLQQERDIAALLESNKAMQRSLDEIRERLGRIEESVSDRGRAAAEAREAMNVRITKLETELSVAKKISYALVVALIGLGIETIAARILT